MAHIGFTKLRDQLAAKGATDPGGLAAKIGRDKYGKAGFAALTAAGRKKKRAADVMKAAKS
jgi:hypothetical protein